MILKLLSFLSFLIILLYERGNKMQAFKVGDKVCDPILGLNGEVINLVSSDVYPVRVESENGTLNSYTSAGALAIGTLPRLFHGHMEPGTTKITFEPKKEPVYEYQWIVERDISANDFYVTGRHYKDANEFKENYPESGNPLRPIEETKRVRKA